MAGKRGFGSATTLNLEILAGFRTGQSVAHALYLARLVNNRNSKDLIRFRSAFWYRDFIPLARMPISALFLIPNFIVPCGRNWNIGVRQLIRIAAGTGRPVAIAW